VETKGRWALTTLGGLVIVYSVLVLSFISTSPDLRLRCLLVNDSDDPKYASAPAGIQIRRTPNLEHQGLYPREGDILVRVGDRPIRSFLDFSRQTVELYNAEIGRDAHLHAGSDPSELEAYLPKLVEIEDGPRMVQIEYWKPATDTTPATYETSWLPIHSLPVGELVLLLCWFLLQLGIVTIAALAFWKRPYDQPVRLFFAMSTAAMGTFAAGHHWWVIAGSQWLLIPFVACAALLPALTLHFFLAFPRPRLPLSRFPAITIGGLYLPPAMAVLGLLLIVNYANWLSRGDTAGDHIGILHEALGLLRAGVYSYFVVAAMLFAAAIIALAFSYSAARTPIERSQLQWMLWAGLTAVVPVGYAIYLSRAYPVEFALGGATLPMFLASLAFMLAYSVGIVRFRLMLLDQVVSRGVLYYLLSIGLAVAFGIAVATGNLLLHALGISFSSTEVLTVGALRIPHQILAVATLLIVSITLLLWLRDRLQRVIDQRFFREKYQLDRTLRRMNRAVGQLADPESLSEMMLASCRDVLQVDRAALYWRAVPRGPFQLVAADGTENLPLILAPGDGFLDALAEGGSLQRINTGTRAEVSPVQSVLHSLNAGLVHGLEGEEGAIALIVLGEKKHRAPYTAEDLTFLHTLGQIANVAFHSVRVHQNLSRLNEELQQKVERIGDQRRQITMLKAELSGVQKIETAPASVPARAVTNAIFRHDAIKGDSPAIRSVLETVRKAAVSESSVLIRGESGTGKELLARVLHENSARRSGPMVPVHCASLAPTLLESELFGHAKGAFTGAHRDKIGRFESADGGTLFLDEIGDLSLETQIKLLRVLQERCFERVGSSRTIHVDVRLITATHQNLEQLIEQGRFREDFYYRLNVISVTIPALRERIDDVFELALHFLKRASVRAGKQITHIDDSALKSLEQYHWPGNIRELENVIERAVVLTDEERITIHDLPADVTSPDRRSPLRAGVSNSPPPRNIGSDLTEREMLETALRQCGGNKAEAARLLRLPRSTYYSKLKKHAIR
jgi:transcriptional regulator with PAS, ATPase and Fis domain